MASAIGFGTPLAPRGVPRRSLLRRTPNRLTPSRVVYRGKRVGDDDDSIHITFRPHDGSAAPRATPAPGVPAKPQASQPAAATGAPARAANGFPSPIEDVSGQDFWGRPRGGAPPAEDVVQIPIEGIPDKAAKQQPPAAAIDGSAPEPELAPEGAALIAPPEDVAPATAADHEDSTAASDSDVASSESDEERFDRGWGTYSPMAAAIEAGRKARAAVSQASIDELAAEINAETSAEPKIPDEAPAAEVVDDAGDELQKGWQFVKDRAGELDSMANDALDEAGAAIQASLSSLDEEVSGAVNGVFDSIEGVSGLVSGAFDDVVAQVSQDFDEVAERVSKSVDEVVGQASRDLDIMAEALGGKPTAPEPTPAASPAPAPARAPAPQPTPTPTVMPTVNLSEADQFEQLADGPRGVKALEAALSDPDHVLTRLTNSLDDEEGDGKNWESAGHPEAMLHRIHYLHRCANYQLSIARRVHRSTLLVRDDDGFQQAGIGSGETPTEKDAADDIAGHLRVLWQKVDLMRRFPVDEEDDASDDSDASDADSSEEEAADDHAAADAADAEQLLARIEAVEDEVLVLKTRAAGSDSYPPVLTVDDDTRNLTNTVDYLRERVDALYSKIERVTGTQGAPSSGDVDGLTERMEGIESDHVEVLGTVEELSQRMDALAATASSTEDQDRDDDEDAEDEEDDGEGDALVAELEERVASNAHRLECFRERLEGLSAGNIPVKAGGDGTVGSVQSALDGFRDEVDAMRSASEARAAADESDKEREAQEVKETERIRTELHRGMKALGSALYTVQSRMDRSQVWVEELIKQSEERQAASLDATLEAKLEEIIDDTIDQKIDMAVAASVQAAGEGRTAAVQDELVRLRMSAQAAAHAYKFQKAATEAKAAQVTKLQEEVEAMRPLAAQVTILQNAVNAMRQARGASSAPVSPAAALWRLVLGAAVIAARAAAAATGALAMLYAAVALPGVRNALHGALAGQPGTVRVPVLAVLGVAAFLATAVSITAGRAATARA